LIGVDKNLYNITAADSLHNVLLYDTARLVAVKTAAKQTVARFKRDDSRIRRRISSKIWSSPETQGAMASTQHLEKDL
jgi:hypothetical protein